MIVLKYVAIYAYKEFDVLTVKDGCIRKSTILLMRLLQAKTEDLVTADGSEVNGWGDLIVFFYRNR